MTDGTGFRDWVPPQRVGLTRWLASELEAEQEQWFLWGAVHFGLGIAGYFALPREPDLHLLAATAGLLVLLHGFGRRAGLVSLLTASLLAAGLGALVAKLRTERVAAPVLVRQTGPIEVRGWIELVEPRVERGQRLTVRVASFGRVSHDAAPYRVRVRTTAHDATLRAGQPVRFKANLGPPPVPASPGDFDFGRLAWFQRLGAIGVAVGKIEPVEGLGAAPWPLEWTAAVERLRQSIRERITTALPGETGEIATALITGERGGISEATNQAYRDSGLFHILSISGLHMVIMAGAAFYLLRLLLALVPVIALNFPIKKWAAVGAIAVALAYLLISGAAFATVRSYLMITIMLLAVLVDRPALALRNVALAALAILIAFPESLLDAGFQMSFAAVTGLVSAYEWLRQRRARRLDENEVPTVAGGRARRMVGEVVGSTLIASAVVAPFGIYHFHNTQLLALIANVIAIPICNLVVMPAALGVLIALPLGLEAAPLVAMGLGIEAMTSVARWVGALPWAVVKVGAIPTHAFAAILAGGLWILLWARPWRIAGVVGLALGLVTAPGLERPDVLVGRDGSTVAVRGADGRLHALAVKGSAFELARWLELDGDRRTPAEATSSAAFVCDAIGCGAQVRGRHLSIAFNPAAMRDDCRRADILVLRFDDSGRCRGRPTVMIDPAELSRAGAHAIYLSGARLRVETVAAARGERPWSGPLVAAPTLVRDTGYRKQGGVASTEERFGTARPEIEDEAWPRGRAPTDP